MYIISLLAVWVSHGGAALRQTDHNSKHWVCCGQCSTIHTLTVLPLSSLYPANRHQFAECVTRWQRVLRFQHKIKYYLPLKNLKTSFWVRFENCNRLNLDRSQIFVYLRSVSVNICASFKAISYWCSSINHQLTVLRLTVNWDTTWRKHLCSFRLKRLVICPTNDVKQVNLNNLLPFLLWFHFNVQ